MIDQATIGAIVQASVQTARDTTIGMTVRSGSVVAINPVVVVLDGDQTTSPTYCTGLGTRPAVGDRVLVLLVPPSAAICLGKLYT